MAVTCMLYNSFDVTEQDFTDLTCYGCNKNGRYFTLLLLCADCGNFLCDGCIQEHIKNSDINHNATVPMDNNKDAIHSRKHSPVLDKPHETESTDAIDRYPTEDIDENTSDLDKAIQDMQEEVVGQLHSFKSLLSQLRNTSTGKLDRVIDTMNIMHDRIADFKETVLKEVNNLEVELNSKLDYQVKLYSERLNKDIATIDKGIQRADCLLKELECLSDGIANNIKSKSGFSMEHGPLNCACDNEKNTKVGLLKGHDNVYAQSQRLNVCENVNGGYTESRNSTEQCSIMENSWTKAEEGSVTIQYLEELLQEVKTSQDAYREHGNRSDDSITDSTMQCMVEQSLEYFCYTINKLLGQSLNTSAKLSKSY